MTFFEERCQNSSEVTKYLNTDREYMEYLRENLLEPSACPLKWWNTIGGKFPTLRLMARDYLGTPSSQASSERLFSDAENTVTDSRCNLDREHVEELCFLHDNLSRL